jgi:hypothetical protein
VFLNKAHYIHIDREVTVTNFEVIDTLMYEANVVDEVERVIGDRGVKWEDMRNCSKQHLGIGVFGL